MIRLGGLVSQKAFGKFEMGKVISNPFATAFIKEGEGEDHEVSMANNSIDTIIKMATELKAKMGEDEKQIPAWIQDHIAKAENLISQASGNYHEYGDSNEEVNEAPNTGERIQNLNNRIKALRDKISATKSPQQKKLHSDRLKNALQSLSNIKKDHGIKAPHRESVVNEAGPCWKGYKQVGMKDKGGKQVPNCVPEGKMNEASTSSAPGEWVAYLSMTRGKKLLKTFNTARGAKQFLSKNVDKFLYGANVESVGIMTKKEWDAREAKYAIEGVNEISAKTPKIFVKTAAVEKKIKELMDDRKKAVVPYNSEKDPKKKEILKQILIKLTKQIQGYEKNLVQLRDMEEEYLQQMHADAELDTSGL